jgi:hypothetical protein
MISRLIPILAFLVLLPVSSIAQDTSAEDAPSRKGLHILRVGVQAWADGPLEDEKAFSLSALSGLRLGGSFVLALGIDIDIYGAGYMLPLYAQGRVLLSEAPNGTAGFVFADLGATLTDGFEIGSFVDVSGAGKFIGAGVGVALGMGESRAISFEFAFRRQWLSVSTGGFWPSTSDALAYTLVRALAGIAFL